MTIPNFQGKLFWFIFFLVRQYLVSSSLVFTLCTGNPGFKRRAETVNVNTPADKYSETCIKRLPYQADTFY